MFYVSPQNHHGAERDPKVFRSEQQAAVELGFTDVTQVSVNALIVSLDDPNVRRFPSAGAVEDWLLAIPLALRRKDWWGHLYSIVAPLNTEYIRATQRRAPGDRALLAEYQAGLDAEAKMQELDK